MAIQLTIPSSVHLFFATEQGNFTLRDMYQQFEQVIIA